MVPKPPEYPVSKKFLDDLIDMLKELELDHIFVHADEQVYAKMGHILWKHPDLYSKVVILMGGFHQVRVRQKTISKRCVCMGYRQWCVDAGIIASGSVDQAVEGRHYYRNMTILEESFSALIQFRFENITKNRKQVDPS